MIKLTKAQRKDLDRIDAHLSGTPFKENARAKPSIPDLALDYVLDRWIPDNISDLGAFHTPTDMAMHVMEFLNYHLDNTKFESILDPCAGTGNLVYPYYQECPITAVELQLGSVKVGKALMPEMEWVEADVFYWAKQDKRLFDLVIMNPPYGITAGMADAESYTGFKVRSQYQFFALAINKCKPGGHIAIVAPWNFTQYPIGKNYDHWVNERVGGAFNESNLRGEFLYTKISVQLWVYRRLDDPVMQPKKPVVFQELPPVSKGDRQLSLWQ